MLKLLLFYNLVIISLIGIFSLKDINSVSNIIFPLLLLPLGWHLGVELVRPVPTLRRGRKNFPVTLLKSLSPKLNSQPVEGQVLPRAGSGGISDRDRRLFLKLVGSTGMSLFFMALIGKKSAQAAFFGSMPGPGTVALKDSTGTLIDPALKQPTDGYNISQLDDTSSATYAYYGFVNKDGNWYIQRETLTGVDTGAYRYFKGSTSFSTNWEGRVDLGYDDFEDIF